MPSRRFVKLCELSDFDDDLLATIRSISPGRPQAKEIHRKLWEYAMLGMYLQQMNALGEAVRVLSVAAGQEPVLFWLANRVGKVVATDIYGDGSFGEREAEASMLSDPRALSPYPYPEDHLEVRHMNAMDLDFDAESFDVVFCLSSIEHFGGPRATVQAVGEMARVLRPGGHLVITTECLLGRHPLDSPKVDFAIRIATLGRRCSQATLTKRAIDAYTPEEIDRDIVAPLAAAGVGLAQPISLGIAPENFDNVILMSDAAEPTSAAGTAYPHIVLKYFGSPWTSIFLAFRREEHSA
jgi:SAM-dependent methyltransferase